MTAAVLLPDQAPACRGAPEAFVVDDRISESLVDVMTDLARRYCARCPVIAECGAFADRTGEVGLWAGALRYHTSTGKDRYRWRPLLPGAASRRGRAARPVGRPPATPR